MGKLGVTCLGPGGVIGFTFACAVLVAKGDPLSHHWVSGIAMVSNITNACSCAVGEPTKTVPEEG